MTGPRPKRAEWTGAAEKWLRANYQRLGAEECARQLNRSRDAIHIKARKLGLSRPYGRHEFTEQMARDLRQVYPNPTNGEVRWFCEKYGVGHSWALRKAKELGLVPVTGTINRQPWSEEELQILHDTAHLTPSGASRRLKAAGYNRTRGAVVERRRMEQVRPDSSGYYGINQITELLGMRRETLYTAIRAGRMQAHQRGNTGDPDGDGRWLVHENALRRYIIANPTKVRAETVDMVWLIDLLANGG
jgi:hypothetical protein